jgi:glycosyltransferase involved in cell wall biosynthesis
MNPVLILVPAFNAEDHLGAVLRQCRYPTLVIDDGSTDRTAVVAREHGARVLRHETNRGKGAALRTGFQAALQDEASAVITLDADGQHEPRFVGSFLRKAEQTGAPILVGARRRSAMPWARRLSNTLTSAILGWCTGEAIADSQCGYRYIDRCVLATVETTGDRYQGESEMLLRAARLGFGVGTVPISTIYAGEPSHIRHFRDTWNFVRLVLSSFFW